jgi:hypothetical protein
MPFLFLKLLRLVAAAFLMLSLLLPWYCVPVSIRGDLPNGYVALLKEPASTFVFKAFLLLFFFGAFWIRYRRRRSATFNGATLVTVCGGVLLVVLTIAYPALTVQRCTEISAHAAWLQSQHDSMNGDLRIAQQYFHRPSQWEVDVEDNLPRAFEAVPTPESSFSEVRLANFEKVLMWLGFSPPFMQFARLGWFCGIFGSFLLAVSFSRIRGGTAVSRPDLRWAPRLAIFVVFGSLLLCSLCLVPVVMAGRELANSQTAVLEGGYRGALRHLDRAEVWMPVLAYHTDVVYQRGWLDRKLGVNSWRARLVSAIREETEGFHQRAAQHYADLLDPNAPSPVRGEAFRGALRLAISDFNTGLVDRAAFRLTELLAIDSSSLKVNYALQLADFRRFRKDSLECDIAQFAAVYRCFQSREKASVIAAAHRRMAQLDFDLLDRSGLGDEMRAAVQP